MGSQLSFGGSSSGSSSSSSSSSTSNRNGNTKLDTDQRIISTGNQFIDGGLLGVVLDSLAALFSAEPSMEAATASTTPAADARDRRRTGRQTQGSLAPSLVEETAAAATVATSQPIPTLATTIPPTISSSVSATII